MPPLRPSAPPVARPKPRRLTCHGRTRVDEYAWLRERRNPAVRRYLKAENRHALLTLADTGRLQRRLYRELRSRFRETDCSVPSPRDCWYYYERTRAGRNYPVYCRRRGEHGREQVLLDLNRLARGRPYLDLAAFAISPDQNLLAYALDYTGDEVYTLYIKDLSTGRLLADRILKMSGEAEWAADNKTLFYAVADACQRPFRICRHELGRPASRDVPVFQEDDESFHVGLSKSGSEAWILATVESMVTSEVHLLPSAEPRGRWRCLRKRRRGVSYHAEHAGNRFYIRSNEGAKNYRLLSVPADALPGAPWRVEVPHRRGTVLEEVEAFERHLVLYERVGGLQRLRIYDVQTRRSHAIAFDEAAFSVGSKDNYAYYTGEFRFSYASPRTPESVYRYDMERRTRKLLKRDRVGGGFDPQRYRLQRLYARASDGTRVPITFFARRDRPNDGTGAVLLDGYGAYGYPNEAGFSAGWLSLADRGIACAIAHVRGGGEGGQAWWEAGKLLRKKNTFTDYLACAKFLVRGGYAAKGRIVARGESAGGLLVGFALNERPDLFAAAVADVPFVDAVNTLLDVKLPLTVLEHDEWGDPRKPRFYRYIKSYAPYENVKAQAYPHLLVLASLNDPRVPYWEPAKWVARMRARGTGKKMLLLRTNLAAGHAGASGRYEEFRDAAFNYAFVLKALRAEGWKPLAR